MDAPLYNNAMQVVPLLLIALFLDARSAHSTDPNDTKIGRRSRVWSQWQDKVFVFLGVAAFMISMLVVAGVAEPNKVTMAVVVAALAGCIGLLFARILRRFDQKPPRKAVTPPES